MKSARLHYISLAFTIVCAPAVARGSVIGFIFGIIPGVSHVVSTFVS